MNNCCFTGYLVENPKTSTVNNVVLAEFVVVVYNYRKTKSTGEKSRIPTNRWFDCCSLGAYRRGKASCKDEGNTGIKKEY